MGMSASQARLIALTARMSDTEYEAQQINQQRLILANKMNEVQEMLVNMDVPTPPSKIDYAIDNFTGKLEGSKVSVRRNSKGKLTAYVKTSGSVVKTTSGTNGGDLKIKLAKPAELPKPAGEKTGLIDDLDNEIQAYTTDQIGSMCQKYYVLDNGTPRHLKESDFIDGVLQYSESELLETNEKNGTEYTIASSSTSGNVTSADGKKTGSVSTIPEAMEDNSDLKNAFEALKHSNPEYSEDELRKLYSLVTYGDGTYAFVRTKDYTNGDGQVLIFEVSPNGDFDEELGDNYEITYSNTGNVNGLRNKATGETTLLTSEQAFDENAYEEATAEYKYKKVIYDQEQNKYNKQTSIYQRQDKMLELKLTRLDNERNALNTEIEAVKKVIQDAIDRGFKTFSG